MLMIFIIFYESNKIFLYLSHKKNPHSCFFGNISNYVSQIKFSESEVLQVLVLQKYESLKETSSEHTWEGEH